MKPKIAVFALCIASAIGAAHAASMCLPSIPSSGTYGSTGTAANNRGYFYNGGSCSAKKNDDGGYDFTCTTYPTVHGEAHCSASGVYPADNWEEAGQFCFCKLTGIQSSNGYVAPRSGGWVFSDDLSSTSYCSSYCAGNCRDYVDYGRGFRRALFASPGLL